MRNFLVKKIKLIIPIFIMLFGVTAFAINVNAGSKIEVNLGKVKGEVGDFVSVPVNVLNALDKELYAIILEFEYDPELLRASGIYSNSSRDFTRVFGKFIPNIEESKDASGKLVQTGKGQIVLTSSNTDAKLPDSYIADIEFEILDKAIGEVPVKVKKFVVSKDLVNDVAEELPSEIGKDGIVFVDKPVIESSISLKNTIFNLDLSVSSKKTGNIEVVYSPNPTTSVMNATYKSLNENVVKVDQNGHIVAVGNGTTTIEVVAFGKLMRATVNVSESITGVEINGSKVLSDNNGNKFLELLVNKSTSVSASVKPNTTTDSKEIEWGSSSPNIAKVDQKGQIQALSAGSAIITAKSKTNKNVFTTLTVNVKAPYDKVELSTNNIVMATDEVKEISIVVSPTDGLVEDAVWSSDNSDIVVVRDSNDVKKATITALNAGTAKITATVGKEILTANVQAKYPKLLEVNLNKSELVLVEGQEEDLIVSTKPVKYDGSTVQKWSSDSDSVVVENGKIKAVKEGSATVTLNIQDKTAVVKVLVIPKPNGIKLNKQTVNLEKLGTEKLVATILPENASKPTIKWSSENANIATVDQSGQVVAKGKGSTKIYAKISDELVAECIVNVKVSVSSVSVNVSNSINIVRGNKMIVTATINPGDSTETKVSWSSSNNNSVAVKSVSDNMVELSAIEKGVSTIKGVIDGKETSFVVSVIVPATDMELKNDHIKNGEILMHRGSSEKIDTVITPSDADSKVVMWSIFEGNDIVTVDSNGQIVAKKVGNATLVAKVGNISKTLKIKVDAPITQFEIKKNKVEILKGEYFNIVEEAVPIFVPNDDEVTDDKTILWTSLNEEIVTVDKDGIVKGLKEGTSKIKGTLKNGLSVYVEVVVKVVYPTDVKFEVEEKEIIKNSTFSLTSLLNIEPFNTTENKVVWSSDDDLIAKVDQNGNVTAVGVGKTLIKAVMLDEFGHDLTASIQLNITEVHLENISIDSDNLTDLKVGDEVDIKINKHPYNTTDEVEFVYESSDNDVATIDKNGHIIVKKAGKTSIKVTDKISGKEVEYKLNITDKIIIATANDSVYKYLIGLVLFVLSSLYSIKRLIKN